MKTRRLKIAHPSERLFSFSHNLKYFNREGCGKMKPHTARGCCATIGIFSRLNLPFRPTNARRIFFLKTGVRADPPPPSGCGRFRRLQIYGSGKTCIFQIFIVIKRLCKGEVRRWAAWPRRRRSVARSPESLADAAEDSEWGWGTRPWGGQGKGLPESAIQFGLGGDA